MIKGFFEDFKKSFCQKMIACRYEFKQPKLKVLIFCVEFWELSYSTRDLSQAEKKITFVTSWAIFSQNDNFDTENENLRN